MGFLDPSALQWILYKLLSVTTTTITSLRMGTQFALERECHRKRLGRVLKRRCPVSGATPEKALVRVLI